MHNCSGMLCKVGPCFQARKILLFFTLVWEVLVLVSCRSCPRIGCKYHESRDSFSRFFNLKKGNKSFLQVGRCENLLAFYLKTCCFTYLKIKIIFLAKISKGEDWYQEEFLSIFPTKKKHLSQRDFDRSKQIPYSNIQRIFKANEHKLKIV